MKMVTVFIASHLMIFQDDVEYKYMVDYWADQENLVDDMVDGATCAPITDYFGRLC